jgi:hypothetical protein
MRLGRWVVGILAGFLVSIGYYLLTNWFVREFTTIGTVPWHSGPMYTPASLAVDSVLLLSSMFLGGLVSLAAARSRSLWPPALYGTLSVILTASQFPPSYVQPTWFSAASLSAMLPAALVGGYVSRLYHGSSRGLNGV